MANERLFYPELALFGLTPPKFMNNRNISVEKDFETILPSKLYRCSICRTRFQDLTSFIKACSNHLTDINFNLEYDQEEVSLRANKSVIKEEKYIDFDDKSQEDENEEESNSSDSNSSDDEDLSKPFERRRRRKKTSISLLPEGHVFLCKLCDKTFIRRQTYRDHLHGHENPMIKCCKICSTQFSSGIIANKHKKKFHPELYKKEMQERAEHRAKFGRPRTVYHTIDANSTTNNVRKLKPKIRSLEIVVENIYLPGIFKNDWIYLPKKRDENQDVAEKVKHEQNTTTVFKPTPNVEKGENEYKMSFDETYEYEEVEVKVESNESDKQTETDNEKNNVGHSDINRKSLVSNYYIKPEEIAHVPDFLGAKYIFNVYDDRRNKKLKEIKKSNKKLEGSRKKQNLSDSSSDNDNSKEVEDGILQHTVLKKMTRNVEFVEQLIQLQIN
uniref:CSON014500 protein n=1 Tax=Culicoides sonorensis TaxID=179676 RepID=A0A336MEP4_CULSO